MLKIKIILILSFCIASVGYATSCNNPLGFWKDAAGAHLRIIDVNKKGLMHVSFKSPNSLYHDGPFFGVGYLSSKTNVNSNPRTMGFSIIFPEGEISTWTGYCQLEKHKPTITSIWIGSSPNRKKFINYMNIRPTIFHPIKIG